MSAEAPVFLDTNVLVYSVDPTEEPRRRIAIDLVEELGSSDRMRTSTQVLQEFFVVTTRKLDPGFTTIEALDYIDDLSQWPVHQVDLETIRRSALLAEDAQISFWDALIVVAASLSGAETLYTEDLNHGQTIHGVKIVNPFAAS